MEKVTGQDTGEATTANLMLPDESTVQVFCGGGWCGLAAQEIQKIRALCSRRNFVKQTNTQAKNKQ